jgi:hypothetical protein
MFRLNRVHEPYRAKCEFKSAVPDMPSEVAPTPSRSSDKKEIVYLPGERLLLKLNKSAKKEKKKKIPQLKQTDVEYLSERMNLILNDF